MKKNDYITTGIYGYEWKQLQRSSSFLWLTLLLFFIGIYAIIYGRNEVNNQQYKINLLKNNIDSLYTAVIDSIQEKDTTASYVGKQLGRLYANQPDGIAALAFGQRDIHIFAKHITIGSYFYDKYANGYENKTLSSEIVNPFKLLSGHLDLSFVLLFLFPLYFILLTYNLYSAEVEGGTLGLLSLQNQSVSKIIQSKLLLRFTIILGLGLLLLFIAGLINGVLGDIRFWLFSLSFIAYIVCWAGIISLFISFKKNSGITALSLLSLWIAVALLIPALLNGYVNVVNPISTRTELSAAVQKANAEVWQLPKPVRVDSFKSLRPQYANAFDTVGNWTDPRSSQITGYLIDYNIEPYEQSRITSLVERNRYVDKLNYFSPVLITQSIFNELGGSNMQQMLAYDTSSYQYFNKIRYFIDDHIFLNKNRMTLDDVKKMPILEFKPYINNKQIWWQLSILFLMGLLAYGIGFNKMKN